MNNDFFGHLWCDLPMIFTRDDTRDFITRENHWHALFYMSSMNNFTYFSKFHWGLFLGSNQQYVSIGSDNCLAWTRWQAIAWTYDDPID